MTDPFHSSDPSASSDAFDPSSRQKLRDHVARLEEENRRLRGQEVPSAAAIELRRENAELRRRLDAETPRPAPVPGPGGGQMLTVAQVARVLNVSTYEVLRRLRDSLPMARDAEGNTVVARADLEAYLVARREGRPTRRFL